MLGKLLGKKKKEYFLELSEDAISAIAEPIEDLAAKVSAPEAPESKAEPTAKENKKEGKKAETAAAKPATTKAAPAIPQLSPAISKAAAAMPQETAKPEPMADPVDVIRNAIAAAGNQSAANEAEETFDYTVPATAAPRRRPGPSMSPFKSLAKDLKKTSF